MAGKRWKLYYDSASSHASPTWVEIGRARDIKMPRSKGKADGSRRESSYEIEESALKTTGLEFGYVYKPGTDAVRDALMASYNNDSLIHVAVADGDIDTENTRYTHFWGEVEQFDIDAPLKGDELIPAKIMHRGEDGDGTLREPTLATVAASTTTTSA